MFCMMGAQASAISFQNIVGEFTSGSLGTYLINHLNGGPYSTDTFLQDIVGAMCQGGVVRRVGLVRRSNQATRGCP